MSQTGLKILVVDDEPAIRKLLEVGLSSQGFSVVAAANARAAVQMLAEDQPELVLLDLGLPDMPGQELLAKWRSEGVTTPILILSSRTDETGIVQALENGADDYVTKPFGMNELIARIRLALRHRFQSQGEKPIYRTGELEVDLVRRIVRLRGEEVKLTPKEYDILKHLVKHAGRVLTHRYLLEKVWDELTDVQYLRVYVRQLRQKIEDSPDQPKYLMTETGVGYRLAEADH